MSAEPQRPPAIFLMGPTATGKSELAVGLAERLPCEIVSVDSAMVYHGLDIGTAKPSQATRARVPHRLIDIAPPDDPYSAARFRSDARREMDRIAHAGRVPLLAGGTLLYFRALEQGLSALPSADPRVRARLETEARTRGWSALHGRLASIDPAAARRIHVNDPQRVQRALEVYELTGRPMTELCRERDPPALPYRTIKLGLIPAARAGLHARIAQRFEAMLARGLIDELRDLRRRYALSPALPSMRAVGYRQAWEYLEGRLDHAGMVEAAVVATRRLAKRQLTWLRGTPGLLPVEAESADARALAATLCRHLD